jgi:hypothetical protein
MLATYPLGVSALVKATTSFVDCTDDGTGTLRFDAMPSNECRWEPSTGSLFDQVVIFGSPGLVSCVIMPLVLLWAIRRKTEKVPFCLCCKCFDSPDKGEPFSYDASYAWATRKYTPSHQWFEIAFIGYKVVTVFTSSEYRYTNLQLHRPDSNPSTNAACLALCVPPAVMLDRPKNAWKLLALLTVYALGFLALIIVLKPFRDHEGHSGWTVGDKGQAVAQVAEVLQYAMAALCIAFGSDMPVAVEGFVILVCLVAIVFPLVYMYQLDKGKDMLGCVFPSEAAAVDVDDSKAVTPVSTENPVATADEDEEADQE